MADHDRSGPICDYGSCPRCDGSGTGPCAFVCPCGELADTVIRVAWADGPRTYRMCASCAAESSYYIEGVTVIG